MAIAAGRDGPGGPAVRMADLGFATKSERIYGALRDAILSGVLEPGSRVNLSRLAQELGASETPVREALKRLESERLVRVEPHAGFVITEVSLADMIENLMLRREVEAVATCLAATSMTDEDLAGLEELVDEMDRFAERSDWVGYAATNKRFHRALVERCPLPVIRRTAVELWEVGERSRTLFVQQPSFESNAEHRKMLDAIRIGDLPTLTALVRLQKTVTIRLALELLEKEQREPSSAEGDWGATVAQLRSIEDREGHP